MPRRFADRVAWVTGGGSGIGRAIALELAREGAIVVVSGRRLDRLQEVVDEIGELSRHASCAIACDVSDEAQVIAAVAAIVSRHGRLDVAIANAGFAVTGAVAALDAAAWRRQLDVNVVGAALTAKHALPSLRAVGGRIALIGSVTAFLCAPKLAAYNASKHAVRAIGQTLAMELAGSGVTCTTVHPGYVESDIAFVDNRGLYDPSKKDRRPRALLWSAEKAAEVIVQAVFARRRELVFTAHGQIAAFLGQHLPQVAHWLVRSSR